MSKCKYREDIFESLTDKPRFRDETYNNCHADSKFHTATYYLINQQEQLSHIKANFQDIYQIISISQRLASQQTQLNRITVCNTPWKSNKRQI